jgi:phosphate transport system protein
VAGHTVHSYDEELTSITRSISDMGHLVQEMLRLAESALKDTSINLVDTARTTDKKINAYDAEIEHQSVKILALRQPMAVDLRLVSSALKIAVIMERMGDLAKNTVKRASRITSPIPDPILADISKMADIIFVMLSEVLIAFQKTDSAKANEVVIRDYEVDDIYRGLMQTLQNTMMAAPDTVPSVIQLIFAVKNIERIGDYVTKTAKIVHYIVSGERAAKTPKVNRS